MSGEGDVRWFDLPPLGDDRLVRFTPAADGPATLFGVVGTSGTPGVIVHRVANGGWGVFDYGMRDWSFRPLLASLRPDVVVVMVGQNDWGWPPAMWEPLFEKMLDRVAHGAEGGEIVVVSTYQSVPLPNALWERMERARAVAARRGYGFIDLQNYAGTAAFFDANELKSDQVHFNEAGGRYVGKMIFDAFETRGRSMDRGGVREGCGDADFDNNGLVNAADIAAMGALLGGDGCPTPECDLADVNRDGELSGEDVDALMRMVAGMPCRDGL